MDNCTVGNDEPRFEEPHGAGAPRGRSQRIGRGQSGEVWLTDTPQGRIATKVFVGGTLGNLIHYVLTGAPNPYIWNEDAVRAAFERRRLLHILIPFWLGDRLAMSDAVSVGWNPERMVWELGTRFVDGTTVPLLHPLRPEDACLDVLTREVMAPLQAHLIKAGFIGTVWQAGKGNPVALNNFLMTAPGRFVFIDAESGIPAVAPLDPFTVLGFYVPHSLRMRRVLFDDVDLPRLRRYLEREAAPLAAALGPERLRELQERSARLGEHQTRWRALSRTERAVAYHHSKGRLTDAQAEHFRRHPWQWRRREAGRGLAKAAGRLRAALTPGGRRGPSLGERARGWAANLRNFVTSQQHRHDIGHRYVETRIQAWEERGQLSKADAAALRRDLARMDEAGSYISDFGAHLGLKGTFLLLELLLLGALAMLGVPLLMLGLIFVLDGPIYRTVYTLWRGAKALAAGRSPPWVALLVGLVPFLGSLAFPAQMVWSARGAEDDLARFILCDSFTRMGEKLPIVNGKDSLVEHRMNRLGMALAGGSARRRQA